MPARQRALQLARRACASSRRARGARAELRPGAQLGFHARSPSKRSTRRRRPRRGCRCAVAVASRRRREREHERARPTTAAHGDSATTTPAPQSLEVTASSRSAKRSRAASRRVGTCSARHAVRRRLVAAQDPARDGLAVDLVGAVVEARGAREAVHLLQRQVGRVAERAVDLQRAVDDVVQHVRAEELDQRDLLCGPRTRPRCPSSTPRAASSAAPPASARPSRRPSSGPSACRPAPSRTRSGRRARSQSMSNARRETPSQRMQWWMRPGPSRCWAIRKPAPRGAEQRVRGHAHVLVDDLGVAAVAAEVLVRVLHRRDVAHDRSRPACRRGR